MENKVLRNKNGDTRTGEKKTYVKPAILDEELYSTYAMLGCGKTEPGPSCNFEPKTS